MARHSNSLLEQNNMREMKTFLSFRYLDHTQKPRSLYLNPTAPLVTIKRLGWLVHLKKPHRFPIEIIEKSIGKSQDCDSSTSAISGNLWQIHSRAALGLTEVVGGDGWWVGGGWVMVCVLFVFFCLFGFHPVFFFGERWVGVVRGLKQKSQDGDGNLGFPKGEFSQKVSLRQGQNIRLK